ncbi:DUF1963 domain-containing protein [Mycobacterium sp. KBS0706]|uniref:DUF1963 domain-containing protein n=1 Tax=Mycobacterium sp. KBS0706 TaxID=2578109 RepID=UPI00110F87CE|nr:DUF1963 domain-containing protein [Mycobacterium sp. KBS0706]TSD87124.1 DUF1963 domain-containing protein [Mycobacterium sp. KBS0706]
MFDTPADAQLSLQDHFSRPQVEIIVEALVPAIAFVPILDGDGRIGGTRIGGTPDLPLGLEWPKQIAPANADEIAARGSPDAAKEVRAHFALQLPYTFVAQIDLAEAAMLGPAAESLPSDGRLLFFYDLISGPYDSGTQAARVIWDHSPRDGLHRQAMPLALDAAAGRYREEAAAVNARYGLEPTDPGKIATPYAAPGRAMKLELTYRLPAPATLDRGSRLATLYQPFEPNPSPSVERFRSLYNDALSIFVTHAPNAQDTAYRQQLLGSPDPEQDDPRYDAVKVTDFGVQFFSREVWAAKRDEIFEKATQWQLLLQIDLRDFMQERLSEGSIYFLIRRDDLLQCRFDRVVAVYQQT